jgi:hypothetical protein
MCGLAAGSYSEVAGKKGSYVVIAVLHDHGGMQQLYIVQGI